MKSKTCDRFDWCWYLSVAGLALLVGALAALTNPGRIDVVDGQTRFEVGRSLAQHGDSIIRDERVRWSVFPGRAGQLYSNYRLPHSLVAAVAIQVADFTGPKQEGRRHFYFLLASALAGSMLTLVYALWFRRQGLSHRAALLWALAGFVCTPNWYYATSTFDDIFSALIVVGSCFIAARTRCSTRLAGTSALGLLCGLVYNVKEPLGVFALVAVALHDNRAFTRIQRLFRLAIIASGLAGGILFAWYYDHYKFPFDKASVHAELLNKYLPIYHDQPVAALADFLLSPGCGVCWYAPALVFGLLGWWHAWSRGERRFAGSILVATLIFVTFHCFVSFFKGDPAWGPRYFTPWIALLWLLAPWGAARLRLWLVVCVISISLLVQLLSLAVDPNRLYLERQLPSSFYYKNAWIYFDVNLSHLSQRPREIAGILRDSERAECFSPAPTPTFGFPLIDDLTSQDSGPTIIHKYQILRGFRPWWCSYPALPEANRPIALRPTLVFLLGLALIGLSAMLIPLRFLRDPQPTNVATLDQRLFSQDNKNNLFPG